MFTIELFFTFLAIFVATIGFSVVFSVPKSELIFCGIVGLVCYIIYYYIFKTFDAEIIGCILGTFCSICLSRTLTFYRRMPLTVYVIPAIIPLAPGGAIYSSMYSLINNDVSAALSYGLYAIKVAGSIGIGITASLSLPKSFFYYTKKEKFL